MAGRRWNRWLFVIPFLLAALAFASAGRSKAAESGFLGLPDAEPSATTALPSDFSPYLYRTNGALADPINLVFLHADPNNVAAAVHRVLGWSVVRGSPMIFLDQDAKRLTGWQMGQNQTRNSRLHLRIEALPSNAKQGYVLAAVHHDQGTACGHVGGLFDQERTLVSHAFASAGYTVIAVWRGNTEAARQCDGSYTAGDGIIVYINLNRQPSSTQQSPTAPAMPPASW